MSRVRFPPAAPTPPRTSKPSGPPRRRLTPHGRAYIRTPAQGSSKEDEKGTGEFKSPAVPATVGGEPARHSATGPWSGKATRIGEDPRARRPARRGRPSFGRGVPGEREPPRDEDPT